MPPRGAPGPQAHGPPHIAMWPLGSGEPHEYRPGRPDACFSLTTADISITPPDSALCSIMH